MSDYVNALDSAHQKVGAVGGTDAADSFPMRSNMPTIDGDALLANHNRPPDTNPETGYANLKHTMERRVFLIYRPFDSCKICGTIAKNGTVNIPEDGAEACPHIEVNEYRKVMNLCLSGAYVCIKETEITQPNGSVVVSVQWMVPVPKKARRMVGPLAQKKD